MKLAFHSDGDEVESNVDEVMQILRINHSQCRDLEIYRRLSAPGTLSEIMRRLGVTIEDDGFLLMNNKVRAVASDRANFYDSDKLKVAWAIGVDYVYYNTETPHFRITYYDADDNLPELMKFCVIKVPVNSSSLDELNLYIRPYYIFKVSDFAKGTNEHHAIAATVFINGESFQAGDQIWIPGYGIGLKDLSFSPISDAIFTRLIPKPRFITSVTVSSRKYEETTITVNECLSDGNYNSQEISLNSQAYNNFVGFKTREDCQRFIDEAREHPKIPRSVLETLDRRELLWALDHPECIIHDEEDKTDEA